MVTWVVVVVLLLLPLLLQLLLLLLQSPRPDQYCNCCHKTGAAAGLVLQLGWGRRAGGLARTREAARAGSRASAATGKLTY